MLSTHSTPAKRDAAVALVGPYLEQRLGALRAGVALFRGAPTLPAVIRGPLPKARRALKRLPQMGDAGAHCMLLFAGDHPVLPVSASAHRLGLRLGYGQRAAQFRKSARSVQQALARELPVETEAFRRAFFYLSHHGTATCIEPDSHCTVCPLLPDCPEGTKRRYASV